MPTEAVEKPVEETKVEDGSGSGTDSDSDDSMPDLEEGDVSAQTSQVRPKKNICVYCHMSKKSRVGQSGLSFYYYFFIILDKTGNSRSGIRFRYLIFENSGKMTNYAVFLPSLLSISTKS